jgi:hypothetical protein
MGLCNSGVSGGARVTGQADGVTLSAAGDYAEILISNNPPPNGPDVSGIFAISGSFVSASIAVQFVPDLANFQADNWQNLNSAIRNDTNTFVNGVFTPPNATALQINPGSVAGLYAIRVYLAGITSGSMLVSGNTNPGSEAGIDTAILAQNQVMTNLLKAQVLALSDMNNTDYLTAVGGSW